MWSPGLITRVSGDWMEVKVPTGEDCTVCPAKSACSFEGPQKAYRVLRVSRQGNYAEGDRVEVEDPPSVLGVAALAFVAAPALLLALGFELTRSIDELAQWPILVWMAGIATWFAVLILANRWVSRSARFQTRIRTVDRRPGAAPY